MQENDLTDVERLKAWLEWRKWCSVWRVRDPQPTEEEKTNDPTYKDCTKEERDRYFLFIRNSVLNAQFSVPRALGSFWDKQYSGREASFASNKNNLDFHEQDDFISEFDDHMKGRNTKVNQENYKDYILYKAQETQKTTGKSIASSINDKIFSPGTGYIRTILTKYYLSTGTRLKKGRGNSERLDRNVVSIDAPIGDDDSCSLLDTIPTCGTNVDKTEMEEIAEELCGMFNEREMLLIYSDIHCFAISRKEMDIATGKGHSANSECLQAAYSKLKRCEYAEDIEAYPKLLRIFLDKIEEKLNAAGNKYSDVLIKIDEEYSKRTQHKINKTEGKEQ